MTPSLHSHSHRLPPSAFALDEQVLLQEKTTTSPQPRVRLNPSAAPHTSPPAAAASPLSSESRSRSRYNNSHSHHYLPPLKSQLNLLVSGWTKLEAVQRWVLERTLDYIPYYNSNVNGNNNQYHHRHPLHSATVQRVLQHDTDDDNDNAAEIKELEAKYKDQIKADADLQALQKQIRTLRQQLQQERRDRERLERKRVAQREKEQKALDAQCQKLKQALQVLFLEHHNTSSNSNSRRDYGKALQRASHRKGQKRQNSFYNKLIAQPIHAIATVATASSTSTTTTTGSSPSTTTTNNNTNNTPNPNVEKEALVLEATILRNMHRTLIYQNQCDVANKYAKDITSSLKQSRAQLDNDNAQVDMYQMVLEGTRHALEELYPEIVERQESLMERYGHMKIVPRRSIPRVIVPNHIHKHNHSSKRRFSFGSSNSGNYYQHHSHNHSSISDLGESVETDDSTKDYSYYEDGPFATTTTSTTIAANGYSRSCFPVFTSVETLQQQTLQHLAGVES